MRPVSKRRLKKPSGYCAGLEATHRAICRQDLRNLLAFQAPAKHRLPMAQEYSFDIASKVDRQELINALDMVRKEVENRFDFKGSPVVVDLEKEHISLEAQDEMKLKQLIDVIQSKLVKRNLSLKAFNYGTFESNVSGKFKCKVDIQNGLNQEQCKKITKIIKDSKVKVQTRIQEDQVRITGKDKDDLQAVMRMVREANFDFDTTFSNYR